MIEIVFSIASKRRKNNWVSLEKFHGVRNVAGRATEVFFEFINHKTDIEDMNVIRQNMVFETIGEIHDVVVGERTGEENGHTL